VTAALAFLALAAAAGLSLAPSRARGDQEAAEEPLGPTSAQTKEFLESGKANPLVEGAETDLRAAQTMPHRGLDRGEALELAEAVFEPELEGLSGIYGQLEPERFLSNYAAVAPVSSLPAGRGQSEDGLAAEHPDTPVLVESTLPLRTEGSSGEEEAVDLELERSEGELQPQNPLTEVGIPDELGEGISLPGSEIEVTVAGAPEERSATDAGGEFAFYPEVAEDTDLIVAPTPQGVETMTDIRSAEAPTETTYDLALPAGAELRATKEGGAEVVEGSHPTLLIPAPTATDAAGNPVQTEMTVSGEAITVAVTPSLSTSFPILVDPAYITEGWRWTLNHDSMAAWTGASTNWYAMEAIGYEIWNPTYYPGLDLTSAPGWGGNSVVGTQANWEYWVPRYREDLAKYHTPPTSWIYQMWSEGVLFLPYGNTENYPALVIGLVDPNYGWEVSGVHYGGQGEMDNWNNLFVFTNEYEQTGDKGADMNLVTYQAENPPKRRDTYMADAYISVVDTDAPRVLELNPPAHWMNTTPEPIPYTFQDEGLGVRSAGISFNGTWLPGWGFDLLCSATTASPCPRVARSGETHVPLAYYPAELPTGKDQLTVTAGDVMWGLGVGGHTASGTVLVKVDHAAPEITLSGSLTEQGSLGTRLPTYALRVNAKDGVAGSPQSGVKKVEVLVDGKKVAMPEEGEWEPSCQTENCPLNGEWTMAASGYAAGAHEVKVVATDAVGNVSSKTLQVELRPPAPSLSLSGTMTEQATLGTERPSYTLKINDSALAESPTPASIPTYSSSFGAPGTGNGQFTRPGSMAIDAQGNLWVVDSNGNRVEKFNEKGEYLAQFGTKGSGNGQLNHPTAIAVAANGNLWVTDSFNRRVEEFTPLGAYVAQFGSAGAGNGQFAGSGPEAIAIDYHGNIWVADTYAGRLEKFSEGGTFIRSVATKGKGAEQLGQPDGIAIAPGGNVFVTDWEDDKVAEYGEGGKFIRQFGSQGSEPGQLQNPTGIAVDGRGDVWVPDQNNGRVEQFNQGGEYLGRFGAKGTGTGQFELSYPTGIATDAKGDIWVTDAGDNRVERWVSANYATPATPTYLRTLGASGPGHLVEPMGLAVDGAGNLWSLEYPADLLEKFSPAGSWLASYGGPGSGNGQFIAPLPLAFNGGHLWVGDVNNGRVEEFGESGAYLGKFGTPGGGAGQIAFPLGIAVDSNHHVWVSELSNNRVQEFTEAGALIRTVGSLGSGNGQFEGAGGIAVGPGNKIFVADYNHGRIEEFNETGGFLRQFAGSPTEVGHLLEPMGLYVDAAEHVWAVDRGHDRVVEFNGKGEYLGQFGSSGSAAGTFKTPEYITGDPSGHLFVSDAGNARVEEWSIPATRSQISTEITVDGKRVEATETSCATETCAAAKEWTLQSSTLSPGSHEVVVRATDGLGNTTIRAMAVKVGDTTKPTLELGGSLVSAPEGWIMQSKGNYALQAMATDKGFGITSLKFIVDGKTLRSKTQTCPGGGCEGILITSFHANEFEAGAHQAEVIATDGAGNSTTRSWTINMDPEGKVTTDEAEATAEALEETSGSPVLAAADEIPGIAGDIGGVGLTPSPGDPDSLQATGSHVPMEISRNPEEGFRLEVEGLPGLAVACEEVVEPGVECVPRGELEAAAAREEEEVAAGNKHAGTIPITVRPAATPPSAAEEVLVSGQDVIAPNAGGEDVDTFTRPMSDGGLSFAAIRGAGAPEHYVYELELSPELHLRQVDPAHVEVFYWKFGITAFVITAEPAHDAIGTAVPTHLSISGPEKIMLTVEYRGQSPAGGEFIYPVMGGTGWQGGYRTITVELTEPPPPPPGEESSAAEGEEIVVGPPEPSTPQAAGVTNLAMLKTAASSTTRHMIRWIRCQHRWEPAPWSPRAATGRMCGDPFTREEAWEEFAFNFGIRGYIYVSPGNFVRHRPGDKTEVECAKELFPSHYDGVLIEVPWFIDPAQLCQWWPLSNGNGGEEVAPGHHLCLYGEWNAGEGGPKWATFQVGSAIWIESIRGGQGYEVSRHKTTLHKCN
jgi:tripartite motif-containing protein 71